MNTKEALKQLAEVFEEFKVHQCFLLEIGNLLKKEVSGKEKKFFNLLLAQLTNIKLFGKMIYTVNGHEQLKGFDGHYYSIHLQQSQFNIRLIVYIEDNGTTYFLSAFYERGGKKQTDYSKYIGVLKQRHEELLKEEV